MSIGYDENSQNSFLSCYISICYVISFSVFDEFDFPLYIYIVYYLVFIICLKILHAIHALHGV